MNKALDLDYWDYNINFWEVFPRLKPKFSYFHKTDRTKGKKRSSDVMWALMFMYHPKSEYYEAPFKDKVKIVETEIIGEEKYFETHKEIVEQLTADIKDLVLNTAAQRQYDAWKETSDKRTAFIKELEYSESNWEMLDKMATQTYKIYQEFDKIKDILDKETKDASMRANQEASMLDKEV